MRPPVLRIHRDEIIVDNFAGGGGASTGIRMALGRDPDIAINHDPEAIAMHKANHPSTKHYTTDVWDIDPVEVCGGRKVGLAWFSPDCFPAGTLILTDRGYRAIEDIDVGDLVLTHQGRYRAVTETMSAVKPIVTVRGQGHPGLSVSPEHPIYTRAAHNVWNNDRRAYDRTLLEPTWTKAADLRLTGAPMNAAGGDLSFWASPCVFPELPIPPIGGRGMKMDERLMWLAGRYVGDGWTRLTNTRAELVITCSKGEADGLREILGAWVRAGDRSEYNELAWAERDTYSAHQFATSHRGLVTWLREEFGHGAAAKGFPAWAFGMSESLRRALLDGYVSADGHIRTISDGDISQCTTVSKTLAFGLRSLGESLGFSVNVNGPYENRTEIDGRQINAMPAWVIKWRHFLQREQSVRDGLHNWTRVRSVESEDRTATVFNLSVEEDESYVAEGVVVHNCTFHSKARGGKPFRDRNKARRRRGLAWLVVRWAKAVRPRVIMLENVEEFAKWGPLGDDGKPCPLRQGFTFRRWKSSLEKIGYTVDFREISACDYGAPTTRKRLFLVARCDGQRIVWPEPTHGRGLLPFRTAAECIDWSLPTYSIFLTAEEAKQYGVKRPLADNTMRRIARGVQKFVLKAADPFIVCCNHGGDWFRGRGVDAPMPTFTTSRDAYGLVTPFMSQIGQTGGNGAYVNDARDPLRTITTKAEHLLVSPLLAGVGGRKGQSPETSVNKPYHTITAKADTVLVAPHLIGAGGPAYSAKPVAVDKPFGAVTTENHRALVTAFLAKHYGDNGQRPGSGMDEPVSTVTASDHNALVAAHISPFYGLKGNETRNGDLFDPLPTITADPRHALVASNLIKLKGTCRDGQPVVEPLHTVQAGGNHYAEVRAFLSRYNGTSVGQKLVDPMSTLDTTDRLGLVTVAGTEYVIVDIGMRMLQPRELYRAQGFPDSYIIDPIVERIVRGRNVLGPLPKDAQVRMCGNSVSPFPAAALARAQFEEQIEAVA